MCPQKILPVEEIRKLDSYTIANEPIKSIDLMERAAHECYGWISNNAPNISNFKVICGMGNNGGDGLAIARMLHKDGALVEIFYIRHTAESSDDNKINFRKAADIAGLIVTEVFEEDPDMDLQEGEMIIDALFGSGLNKPVTGFPAKIIKQINESKAYVVSIDIPSGLFADTFIPDINKSAIVQADYTLTFQMPKLAFMMPENDKYVGKWEVLNINLNPEYIESAKTNYYLTNKQDCSEIYRPRKRFSHKGNYGHALLIAGSLGKIGASILAAKACLRSGAGLVTAHIPLCGMDAIQASVPEVMTDLDVSETHFTDLATLDPYNAIAIGPGLGMHDDSQKMMKLLIQEAGQPLIIDADGLNILAENKTWLPFLPADSILTPHPKEFERLTSKVGSHFNRLEILQAFSTRYKLYVILKGAYSAVACPDGSIYFNPTGNPGMATGGTGDVLTGILLGLKASGYTSKETCILGAWLHGKAGDIASKKVTQPAMIATDIIDQLGNAFKKIY
jgi:ADP-dependent NAD(P)H-hydrate dehydratase / NAD(P)H-hydrate epimerase